MNNQCENFIATLYSASVEESDLEIFNKLV